MSATSHPSSFDDLILAVAAGTVDQRWLATQEYRVLIKRGIKIPAGLENNIAHLDHRQNFYRFWRPKP